ncbi:MAG TPA: pseudouridine synthase, partial [Kofleriaceae bacterium]|nr:pseudouridine synthase [Kofleriaceae bacterium]
MSKAPSVRLQRFLSQAGVAARRKAEDLIRAGRVTVDGEVVTELGTKVDPDTANVQVDGEPVAAQEHIYILFNKPKGCITAVSDDRGRLTVMDYLPNVPVKVAPVGRLDFYSEGVLLLTNDGELAARLLAPRSHVAKTYHVKIRGTLGPGDLQQLREGVTLDDGTVTLPAEVDVVRSESKHHWLVITLHEGKSRQIHRMLEALGHQVQKLQRVAFANLSFHGLRVGDARELTQAELNDLRELVGLDRRAVARGQWSAMREDTDAARRAHAQRQAERAAQAPAGQLGLPGFGGGAGGEDGDDEEAFERELEAARRGRRGPSFEGGPRAPAGRGGAPGRGAARGGSRATSFDVGLAGSVRPERARASASATSKGRPRSGRTDKRPPGRGAGPARGPGRSGPQGRGAGPARG